MPWAAYGVVSSLQGDRNAEPGPHVKYAVVPSLHVVPMEGDGSGSVTWLLWWTRKHTVTLEILSVSRLRNTKSCLTLKKPNRRGQSC